MGRGSGRVLAVALISTALQLPSVPPANAATPIARGWGSNTHGQLGDNTTASPRIRQVAVNAPGGGGQLGAVARIDGGQNHTVVAKDGTVYTFGHDGSGQLGNGVGNDTDDPVQVGLFDVLDVDAGNNFTLALVGDGTVDGDATDGDVYAWGSNANGQVGIAGPTNEQSPVSSSIGDVVDIAGGQSHTLALKRDGTVWAWGDDDWGQLGDGTEQAADEPTPEQVIGVGGSGFLTDVVAVDAGALHSVALKSNGSVVAWGFGGNGQRGDGSNNNPQPTPVLVRDVGNTGTLSGVSKVVAGGSHTLALKTDGTAFGWGSNQRGQVGNNTAASSQTSPVQVKGEGGTGVLEDVTDVAAGNDHSLAVVDSNFVYGWGRNDFGQMGIAIASSSDLPTPVQVLQLFGAVDVAAGMFHSLAVADADTASPTGTISIDGGATYTNSTSVTLTLTSDDGTGTGVTSMRFSNGDTNFGAWEVFSASKSYTLPSGDGSKTVRVQYRDAVGNISSGTTSDDITLDATPPTGTISINNDDQFTASQNVTLTLSASDDGSGIEGMEFSDDGTTFTSPELFATPKSYALPAGDGTKTVHVRYTDAAGNVSTPVSDTITLDTTNPTGTISINGSDTYTNDPNVTLTLSADDPGGSGVNQMAFSDDGTTFSADEPFDTSKSYTLPAGDGVKTVHARFTDAAGNVSSVVQDSITLDTTAPTVVAFGPRGRNVGRSKSVTATFSDDMDASTLTGTTVWLFNTPTKKTVGAVVGYDAGTDTVTLDPAKRLKRGTKYKVTITNAVENAAGTPLAQPFTWKFRTKS